ncbi:hypothetical protein K490DRAFT_18138, partial [Saccharata proteae CBS 121410]
LPPTRLVHMSYTRPPRQPVHLVLDWDGTLTNKDTTEVLVKISSLLQDTQLQTGNTIQGYQPSEPPLSLEDRHNRWDRVVNAYIDDFSAHADAYRPSKHERSTIDEESAWLASLHEVEDRSVARVQDAGILAGHSHKAVEQLTKEVMNAGAFELRNGWRGLFEACMLDRSSEVEILSVNWSTYFIETALALAARNSLRRAGHQGLELRKHIEKTKIQANHVTFGKGRLKGGSGSRTRIRTSNDKLMRMPLALKKGGTRLVVYVGDSTTDFDALLAADIGICVRDKPLSNTQKELADTFERVGVDVRHIR